MNSRFEFRLTPAYCLYNGAAVLEQEGASIRFLIENEEDSLLKDRLTRAFQTHLERILKMKECPESFRRLPSIDFVGGNRNQLRKCVSKLYRAEDGAAEEAVVTEEGKSRREAAAVLLLDSILNEARSRKATDIHIEHNCVRLRVAGRLEKLIFFVFLRWQLSVKNMWVRNRWFCDCWILHGFLFLLMGLALMRFSWKS